MKNGQSFTPDAIWGRLSKLRLPSCVVSEKTGVLTLEDAGLSVLTALLFLQKRQAVRLNYRHDDRLSTDVLVIADRETLMWVTGISKNIIAKGVKQLEQAGYVEKIMQRGEGEQFADTQYLLLNPKNRQPLRTRSDNDILHGNGLHYFTIPSCMFAIQPTGKTVSEDKWYSFSTMTFAEKKLYLMLVYLATQRENHKFDTTADELRGITGLSHAALKLALDELESRWLIADLGIYTTIRKLQIHLRHPISGDTLDASDWEVEPRNYDGNYYEKDDKGNSTKANLRMSPEQQEKMFLELIAARHLTATEGNPHQWSFCCPFHDDSNPSCSYNSVKGCFNCHGCPAKGHYTKLFYKLGAVGVLGTVPKEEIIKQIGTAMGKELEYIKPDFKAIASYSYKKRFGV
jgi:hypothetical protein